MVFEKGKYGQQLKGKIEERWQPLLNLTVGS